METKLTPELLIAAYSQGFFPMPAPESDEIQWFCPNPRAVLPLQGFHLSRSMQKKIKKNYFRYTVDLCFQEVIEHCANRDDVWINEEIISAYTKLHHSGNAHSIEVWHNDKLAGGLYGVQIGRAFFAESKYHTVTDASKAAVYFLVDYMKSSGLELLEVQFQSEHLKTLGVIEISHEEYMTRLDKALRKD